MEFFDPGMIGDVTVLAVLSVVLLAVLLLLRMMFKLTKTVFRLGCILIFILVLAVGAFLFVT